MTKQTKTQLAPLSKDVAAKAANATVKAIVTCEKAKRTLLTTVSAAVEAIGMELSAAQYDRQFKPYLAQSFAREVQRKAITSNAAKQYESKLKTAVLAILCKVAEPVAGETFWEFYDRAAQALPSAKLANGAPVWESSAKRGPKAGSGKGAGSRKGTALPGVVAEANASAGSAGSVTSNVQIAAARILTKGNMRRALALIWAVRDAPEVFDKWIQDAMPDAVKAEIGGRLRALDKAEAAKAPVVAVKPEEKSPVPDTAMAAALVEGQRRQNQKRQAA